MATAQNKRSPRIAVASGKGGTGKTMVSLNLAAMYGQPVQLADCDVEEPNVNLFLNCTASETNDVNMPVPQVDSDLCTGCGACGQLCRFRGIVSFGSKALVFPELCHGCGGCSRVCPTGAITERPHLIGTVSTGQAGDIKLVEGRLEVGSSSVPPVIRAVRNLLVDSIPAILDSPPGTSCPVVATLRDVDYVLLVSDPTPFGLHDLKLAVATVKEMGLPCGVVINRSGDDQVGLHMYCRDENIPVMLSIPDDRLIAEAVSRGELISKVFPEYGRMFAELGDKLRQLIDSAGGRP